MAAFLTFERECHRLIGEVLARLNAERLDRYRCLFAGGTRIALELSEFRESRDVDFLCSDAPSYADLRVAVRADGYRALFSDPGEGTLVFPREPRADQYGIRFPVVVHGTMVRVELVREARIELGEPVRPAWSPIACLSIGDCFTEKLLANSDRWADRDTLSRDLIDLAALCEIHGPIPERSWNAALTAYREVVRSDLGKAARAFLSDATYRDRCFAGLKIAPDRSAALLAVIEEKLVAEA